MTMLMCLSTCLDEPGKVGEVSQGVFLRVPEQPFLSRPTNCFLVLLCKGSEKGMLPSPVNLVGHGIL